MTVIPAVAPPAALKLPAVAERTLNAATSSALSDR